MLSGHPSGAHPPSLPRARSVTAYKRPDTWLLCQNNLIVCVGCRIGISNNTHVMFAWSHLCCWVGLQRLGLTRQCCSLRRCRFLQRFISCVLIVCLAVKYEPQYSNLNTVKRTKWLRVSLAEPVLRTLCFEPLRNPTHQQWIYCQRCLVWHLSL